MRRASDATERTLPHGWFALIARGQSARPSGRTSFRGATGGSARRSVKCAAWARGPHSMRATKDLPIARRPICSTTVADDPGPLYRAHRRRSPGAAGPAAHRHALHHLPEHGAAGPLAREKLRPPDADAAGPPEVRPPLRANARRRRSAACAGRGRVRTEKRPSGVSGSWGARPQIDPNSRSKIHTR